ncbi:MAG: IS91 family transposase [Acidobacteriota bacterium]
MTLAGTYRPRHPETTAFYQCLEDYWPEFQESYPYFYERDHGPLRPVVEKTVERFLDCGIFHQGFARVRCRDCDNEYLLAFSCKTRYFCPSCQAKRVAAFVEWVTEEVLEPVDHRQLVWTIPKVLRATFRRDRRLLGELSRCAWKSLREYSEADLGTGVVPGAIFAIQSYGDQLNFHPHLHSLVSDMGWSPEGVASRIGWSDSQSLTRLFQHHVLEMMVHQRRLSPEFAEKLRSWRHSGFHVYWGRPVEADDQPALERLAAYLLRPSFAATRLRYDSTHGQIEYRTAKGLTRSMDALDWIALVISHIPNVNEHMVRYYGRYSNASRGKRRREKTAALSGQTRTHLQNGAASESEQFSRERRRNWARLLRKIYEADPLVCTRCGSPMEIISFIEQRQAIQKILQHLDLWERPQRSPPSRLFPHKLEAFLATLSPQQARLVRASSQSIFWDDVPTYPDF